MGRQCQAGVRKCASSHLTTGAYSRVGFGAATCSVRDYWGGGEKRSRLWDPLGERWGIFSAADGTARHIVPWQRAEHLLAPQARIGGAWLLLRSLPGSWGSLPLAFSQRQGRIGRIGSTFPGAKAPLSHSKRFSLFQQLLRMRLRSPPSAPPRNSARAPPPGRCAGPSAAPVLR